MAFPHTSSLWRGSRPVRASDSRPARYEGSRESHLHWFEGGTPMRPRGPAVARRCPVGPPGQRASRDHVPSANRARLRAGQYGAHGLDRTAEYVRPSTRCDILAVTLQRDLHVRKPEHILGGNATACADDKRGVAAEISQHVRWSQSPPRIVTIADIEAKSSPTHRVGNLFPLGADGYRAVETKDDLDLDLRS